MERLALNAMGTRFELVLADDAPTAHLRAAGEAALEEISEAHRNLSAFARDSVIAHLNRAAALGPQAGPIPIDGETWFLLLRCEDLVQSTDGAFDPGLGRRMAELGFRPADSSAPESQPHRCGWREAVRVDPDAPRVEFCQSGVAIDLGGVAKGYALDLAAEALAEAGVQRALLHGGTSTVLAMEPPTGQEHWRIALGPEPDAPVAHLRQAVLSLSDLGGRTVGPEGATVSHVLDPTTGHSATGASRAAVVLPLDRGDALSADALSTAALVRGPRLDLDPSAELWTLGHGAGDVQHRLPAGQPASIRQAFPSPQSSPAGPAPAGPSLALSPFPSAPL